MGLKEEYLTEVAAEFEWTRDQLASTASKVEKALQERLPKHYENSHLHGGRDHWLMTVEQGVSPGVYLGFNKRELARELREAGYEAEPGQVGAVAIAHLDQFQDMGFTVGVPGAIARQISDPVFYPVFVEYPEGWQNGEYHSLQRFQHLLGNFGLTPAEALDYWAMQRMGKDANDWAGVRGVDPAAVRKNSRQAREKMEGVREDETESPYESSRLRVVDLQEIPSGDPHDPDKDMFYVPLSADEAGSDEPDLSSVD